MSRDSRFNWKPIAQTEKKLAEYWEARCAEEKEHATNLIADLLFAYINKDENHPHDFEIKAFEDAITVLRPHFEHINYHPKLFVDHLERMRRSYRG